MGAFYIPVIVFTPFYAWLFPKLGRKTVCIIGSSMLIITNFALGLVKFVPPDNPKLFIALSFIARFFQGFGDSMLVIASYSVITSTMPDNKEKYIGQIEGSIGIGIIVGPIIGSFIYGLVNYEWVFYSFGFLMIYNFLCLACVLPSGLNVTEDPADLDLPSGVSETMGSFNTQEIASFRLSKKNIKQFNLIKASELSIFNYFKCHDSRMSIIASFFGFYNMEFYGGFMALHMYFHYDIPEDKMGFVFLASSLPYCIGCLTYPGIFNNVPAKL